MEKIIFVYNADSGLFNTLSDFAHKMISPKTYSCNLCAITHPFRMSKDWKAFIESLAVEIEFLHRDELDKKYGITKIPLPTVFKLEGRKPDLLIRAEEINLCKTLEDLKALVLAYAEAGENL